MTARCLFLYFSSLTAISGCGVQTTLEADSKFAALETRLAALESAKVVNDVVDEAQHSRLVELEANASEYTIASFRTTDEGYSVIKTRFGPMLVSINGVESIGDGSRVTFNVGNITTAVFSGADVGLMYLAKQKDGGSPEWLTIRYKALERLNPGAWTMVSVNIPGVPPTELSEVRIGIELDHMAFR